MNHLRALIFLFAANTISGFAQGITMLAIPWFVIQTPNGNFKNAAMIAIVTFISLFWGIYAGTLIDKYNRKRIFQILTAVDTFILIGVSMVGFSLGEVPFLLIATIYGATYFTYNVHYPNLYAFVQELFEPKYYARVNSAIEIQGQITNFIGMMLGGILIDGPPPVEWWPIWLEFEPWTLQEIFLLDGSTYVLGFILISLIPYKPSPSKKIDSGSVMNRISQGFKYLMGNRPIFIFGITSHVLFFSLLVVIQVVMPVYVNDYLEKGAFVLSSFKGFYALGAISAGVLGLSLFVKKHNLISQIMVLLAIAGLLYFILFLTKSFIITLAVAYLIGICNAGVRILRITYLVKIVPNRVIGRVNSFLGVINVLMRICFLTLMTIPFFGGEGNGQNIIYAFMILALIMWFSTGVLAFWFNRFDHSFAKG